MGLYTVPLTAHEHDVICNFVADDVDLDFEFFPGRASGSSDQFADAAELITVPDKAAAEWWADLWDWTGRDRVSRVQSLVSKLHAKFVRAADRAERYAAD